MKNGQLRFEYYLNQLQELITKASKQKNPALWLYQNNARTPLFMLEGLAKLYAGLHNKKKFSKIKEQVKLLEDGIGQIDYYDAFAKEFVTNKKMPATITNYLQAQAVKRSRALMKYWLKTTGWAITQIVLKRSGKNWGRPTGRMIKKR
jgi:type I site-specific restriction endonuclease